MRPWGKFWRLLDEVAKHSDSAYIRALRDDPDVAARAGAEYDPDDETPWRPPAADWSLQHELLGQIRDTLTDIAVITGKGLPGENRRFAERFPRPQTETDRAIAAAKAQREKEYDERLLDFVERGKQRYREAVARGEISA